MPATTWRLNSIDTADQDLEISQLELWGLGSRVDSSATITCSHAPIAGTLTNLSDSSSVTTCKWAAKDAQAPGFFIQWVLAAAATGDEVRIGSAAGGFPNQAAIQTLDTSGAWKATSPLGAIAKPSPVGSTVSLPFDANWTDVVLLVRGTATGAKDVSQTAAALTVSGTVTSVTTPVKFGPQALDFGTTGSGNYLTLPNPSLLAFESKNFTIEANCYFRSTAVTTQQVIYHNYLSAFAAGSVFFGRHTAYGLRVVFWPFNAGNTAPLLEDPNPPPTNAYVHYAVCRQGSSFYLLRDGAVVSTGTYAGALTTTTVANGFISTGSGSLIGLVEDLRVTMGVARYANGEPAPTRAPAPTTPVVAGPIKTSALRMITGAQGTTPIQGLGVTQSIPAPGVVFDYEFGGFHRVYGTVAVKGTPANIPLRRRVRLHRSKDGMLIRETWSKTDGTYEFNEINGRYEYDVIAWDNEMSYRSVVANNLTPEAM